MPFLHDFLTGVLSFFGTYTLPALLILLLVEESGIPIPVPGDTLLVLAGALAVDRPTMFTILALAGASLAVVVGSSLLYGAMRLGGRRFLARYGRFFYLGRRRMARVERWFKRHYRYALLIGRLVPGLRIPTTAMAGLTGLRYRRYLPSVAVAAIIWSATFFGLGAAFRLEGPVLLRLTHPLLLVVSAPLLALMGALVLLDVLLGLVILVRNRRSTVTATEASLLAKPTEEAPTMTSARK
jgi:membrane protein DedA with SNARE-associated domain